MRYLALIVFAVSAFVLAGCSTAAGYVGLAQEQVLPKLEPDQRAAYRGALQNAVDNYDDTYDMDGIVWSEDNPKPSDTLSDVPNDPTDTPAEAEAETETPDSTE